MSNIKKYSKQTNQDMATSKDEMRFFRRDLINDLLHRHTASLLIIKRTVRLLENDIYDIVLKIF